MHTYTHTHIHTHTHTTHTQGYRQRYQYILTQGPLVNTVNDFWRMVWEHNSYNIIMLCPMEENGIVMEHMNTHNILHL